MADAPERLTRLIELASHNTPEMQRALAFELCDLLTNWPERYPSAMREPFEALLEKVLPRLDSPTRRIIATHLAAHAATALALLNEFYFDMPAETRAALLARNAAANEASPHQHVGTEETHLIAAARETRGREFAQAFADFLGVPAPTAERILEDAGGDALAVACKGAHVKRVTYSVLALLSSADLRVNPTARYERLASFDEIPEAGAANLLASWRRHVVAPQENTSRAA